MIWLFALLLSMTAHGGKSKQAYYETREMRLTVPANLSPASLRDLLRTRLSKMGVKVFAVEQSDGTRVNVKPRAKGGLRFKDLSYAAVMASFVPLAHDLKGAEMDLFVHNEKKELVPVTLWWDAADRALIVREGAPVTSIFLPAPDGVEVVKTFGTGPLVSVGRRWSPEAIGLLYSALSRLSEEERALLAGVPFHRETVASKKLQKKVIPKSGKFQTLEAVYTENASGAHISVFDSALKVTGRFTGSPDKPEPVSLLTLVHEMGHALARSSARKLMREHDELHASFEASRESHNQLLDQRNRLYEKNQRPSNTVVRKLQAMDAQLTGMREDLDLKRVQLQSRRDEFNQMKGATPVAKAMLKVLGKLSRVPTMYGRVSPEEAFAECFSLFHLDPRALKRAAPDVYAWFEAGEHLRAME